MARVGLKALAAAAACAAGFVSYMWLTDDGRPAVADARSDALGADVRADLSESPVRNAARLVNLQAADPIAPQDASAGPLPPRGSFSARFAFGGAESAQPRRSFADRFSGESQAVSAPVQSASPPSATTVARVAAPRVAARVPVPPAAPKRTASKSGFQLASASETSVTLAYAPADTGTGAGSTGPLKDMTPKDSDPLADVDPSRTAIYDISARTVYLPNGRRLEAHSGLGDRMDDPSSVSIRSVGVTPPNVYDLRMRESPFHGVRAIRLVPRDESKMYGRTGILAHTYMLGPNGQSNGCVSFRDYPAFLAAYERGDITRLVVVERLAGSPPSPKSAADWIANTLKGIFERS